jgi:hypothetical protein
MAQLIPPKAPNLPFAPREYDSRAFEALTNALRLYFNQIDGGMRQILQGFNNYASFYDTTTQANPVANVMNLVTFNTVAEGHGVVLGTPSSRITVAVAGVYNFQFSAQVDKTGGGNATMFIWFRRNGVDLTDSATKITIAGPNAETVAAWNYLITMQAGDYFELAWSSADTAVVLRAEPAAAPAPSIPSVIMTVTYVYPNNT